MIYENDKFDIDLLKEYVKRTGMKESNFCKLLFGSKSHYTLRYFEKKNAGLTKVVKLCNLLNIHFDDLFFGRNTDGNSPSIYGNNNIQNSTVINNDIASLRAENMALKEINDMLKKENADLGRRLDNVIDIIRKSDSTK